MFDLSVYRGWVCIWVLTGQENVFDWVFTSEEVCVFNRVFAGEGNVFCWVFGRVRGVVWLGVSS